MQHFAQGQRQLRVGEQLRHTLSEILQRGHFRDPDLAESNLITVNEVRISPDLKNATVFVMPLGGSNLETVIPALNRASSYIRSELGKRSNLRFTPRITFEEDHTFAQADKIEELLRGKRVSHDLENEDHIESE